MARESITEPIIALIAIAMGFINTALWDLTFIRYRSPSSSEGGWRRGEGSSRWRRRPAQGQLRSWTAGTNLPLLVG